MTQPAPEDPPAELEQAQGHRSLYEALEVQLADILRILETAPPLDPPSAAVVDRMWDRMRRSISPQTNPQLSPDQQVFHPRHPASLRQGSTDRSVRPKTTEPRRGTRSHPVDTSDSESETSASVSSDSPLPQERIGPAPASLTREHQEFSFLLEKLDNRKVPRPEPFDPSAGRPFKKFLAGFESYCAQAFRAPRDSWIPELGRLLEGEAALAFTAYRSINDSYDDIRAKLLRWYRDGGQRRRYNTKKQFAKATRQLGEKLCYYAPRLQNLFELAYPAKSSQHSSILREKFMDTIPRQYRRQIKAAQQAYQISRKGKLKWTKILALVNEIEEEMTEPGTDCQEVPVFSHQPQNRQSQTFTNSNRRLNTPRKSGKTKKSPFSSPHKRTLSAGSQLN